MPLKKKCRPKARRDNPHYKRDRLKRVWSKLVDLTGESPEGLDLLRDFLDDLLDGYAGEGAFGAQNQDDPRRNGKQGELTIY